MSTDTKSIRADIDEKLWEDSKYNFQYFNVDKSNFFEISLELLNEQNYDFLKAFLGKLVEQGRLSETEMLKRLNLIKQKELDKDIYSVRSCHEV